MISFEKFTKVYNKDLDCSLIKVLMILFIDWRLAANITRLIALLQSDGRFKIEKVSNGTSRFLMSVPGVLPEAFINRALKHNVVLPHPHPDTGLFQMQVNPTLLRISPEKLARIFIDSIKA